MKLVNWNVEWATPRSPRRAEVLRRIKEHGPEVVCLTETHDELLDQDGYTISSQPDYGYAIKPHRRKVMLWSREPWQQVDDVGIESMPPGRFVSGVTRTSLGEVTVVGICIPWHCLTERKKTRGGAQEAVGKTMRNTWTASLKFLKQATAKRLIVAGDFNQVIGAGSRAPRDLRSALENAFSQRLTIITSDLTFDGRKAIDHIALSNDLKCESLGVISNIDGDRELSDHFGVFADIMERRSQ